MIAIGAVISIRLGTRYSPERISAMPERFSDGFYLFK